MRLELLRMGLEDKALLGLLPKRQRLRLARKLVRGATNYTIDSELLEATRREAAALIGSKRC